ncbi:IclR family transcriptional regulator [Campylobacter canadensis]|uniref:Helix-turn-helix domain-containing protein n=1 Tax=Campylobacter canadensis TaxID=449520 RepID=A0ABS7WSV9_9BACT|nr:IclR family transcriptional regulator C-terminal domain-containing protein [Campylobacter canadensis]MBZ7987865.1 helix-turn-helix domain-containing protein [Campylobacter canadensis]MBZ7994411.1 helix-turn-helix domain-containing protein [Campylobacter canadensis]MBZ7996107.1 helix-turn-helix domain-containing protein [Campylobacter canadensis]MBZ7998863.1 helix-turn-helix domain-containing protein [Campylobacter canadensis]MBZ7999743.1 helix-turn-helix domain-containing protein [Campyloba
MLHKPTLRVIKILELLQEHKDGLNITNISLLSKISVGTLHPILQTLLKLEYLKLDNKNYILNINLSINSDFEIIKSNMNKIAQELKQSVQLGILKNNKVYYLHKCNGNSKIILKTTIGDSANLYATALGKALLLNSSESEIKNILNTDFVKNTEKTISNIDDFIKNMKELKKLNFTYEIGEFDEDFACIAVAICKANKIIAALSVTILKFHYNEKIQEQILSCLNKYKAIIENSINNY